MKVIKAPEFFLSSPRPYVFLAGSIEMGVAENWQARLERELADEEGTILNPRRDDWDSSWVQSIKNEKFREQVEWELDAMTLADVIAMHFDVSTKSPITLLELGLYAESGNLIVDCGEGFWRRGNVEIVCAKKKIPMVPNIEALIAEVKQRVSCNNCLRGEPLLVRQGCDGPYRVHELATETDKYKRFPLCTSTVTRPKVTGR